jgi:hypothetical protein
VQTTASIYPLNLLSFGCIALVGLNCIRPLKRDKHPLARAGNLAMPLSIESKRPHSHCLLRGALEKDLMPVMMTGASHRITKSPLAGASAIFFAPALLLLRCPQSLCSGTSCTTGLRKIPIPSISTSTVLPGCKNTGGLRAKPTPGGVPVKIKSPAFSVHTPEI